MNSVEVTSCSHSHGRPMTRVTMSAHTESEKPKSATPQSTISARSSQSSARHFRWRWRSSTNLPELPTPRLLAPVLLDGPDQVLHLLGVGAELLGELVEVGIGDLLEAGLVDLLHHLDADRLYLRHCLVLELEALLRLLGADVAAGREDPLALVGIQALPELVADPEDRVVRLVLGDREHRRHLVV